MVPISLVTYAYDIVLVAPSATALRKILAIANNMRINIV